jgi:hypothetical protein
MQDSSMLNNAFLLAAFLSLVVGVIHSWLGERMLIGPLLAPQNRQGPLKSTFMCNVLRYAWHITSVAWAGLGLSLAALTLSPLDQSGMRVAAVVGITFLISGVLVLVAGRGRHLSWLMFLAIAVLAFTPFF